MTDHGNLMLARVRACAAGQPAPDERPQAMPHPTATPGPWTTDGRNIIAGPPPHIRGKPGWKVIGYLQGYDNGESQANARLMAAAPAMLGALREILSQIDQGGTSGKVFGRDACIAQARAAIAKAEG